MTKNLTFIFAKFVKNTCFLANLKATGLIISSLNKSVIHFQKIENPSNSKSYLYRLFLKLFNK